MNNVASLSTISSTVVRVEEQPKNREGSFLSTDKSLQVLDNSGDSNTAIPESNVHSNFEFGKVGEVQFQILWIFFI